MYTVCITYIIHTTPPHRTFSLEGKYLRYAVVFFNLKLHPPEYASTCSPTFNPLHLCVNRVCTRYVILRYCVHIHVFIFTTPPTSVHRQFTPFIMLHSFVHNFSSFILLCTIIVCRLSIHSVVCHFISHCLFVYHPFIIILHHS